MRYLLIFLAFGLFACGEKDTPQPEPTFGGIGFTFIGYAGESYLVDIVVKNEDQTETVYAYNQQGEITSDSMSIFIDPEIELNNNYFNVKSFVYQNGVPHNGAGFTGHINTTEVYGDKIVYAVATNTNPN